MIVACFNHRESIDPVRLVGFTRTQSADGWPARETEIDGCQSEYEDILMISLVSAGSTAEKNL